MFDFVLPLIQDPGDAHGQSEVKTITRPKLVQSVAAPLRGDIEPNADNRIDIVGSPVWQFAGAGFFELGVRYDPLQSALWQTMTPRRRPSFTTELLREMTSVMDLVETAANSLETNAKLPIRYLVLESGMPGIFNLGGDLRLFLHLIGEGDEPALRRYAHACIEVQYRRASNLGLPIHTICLVQGDALGGGFEAALAHDVIIAERSAKFGLPEILFNLFPGMGAHSFLSRRVGTAQAERMMLSGQIYTAAELHALGVVDVLAEDGEGATAVQTYIQQHERSALAREAVFNLRRMVDPVTRDELMRITDHWVDTALRLSPRDLRRMEHLATAQERRWARITRPAARAGR